MARSTVAFLLMLPMLAVAQVSGEPATYRVQSEVWSSGQLLGRPELTLQSGKSDRFEIGGPNAQWRLGVELQEAAEREGAERGALWLAIDIEEKVDGEWLFLTDTMLGLPPGKPGRIMVLGEDESTSVTPRENAPLFVEISAERVAH